MARQPMKIICISILIVLIKARPRGRDRMLVGFTTIYTISAYNHQSCETNPTHGEVYSIQHCDKACR